MYILMDMEWVESASDTVFPTQLGALRVDERWEGEECYYSRIRPEGTGVKWKHMAFAGGTREEFLAAPTPAQALGELLAWLGEGDVLCWWAKEPALMFQRICAQYGCPPPKGELRVLQGGVLSFCKEQRLFKKHPGRNPYLMAPALGLEPPAPMHHAARDVEAIQMVLRAVTLPVTKLARLFHDPDKEDLPYRLDIGAMVFHRRGCSAIPQNAQLRACETIKPCFRQGVRPCARCVGEEFRRALRMRNRDSMARAEYNFVYSPTSKLFHRYDCPGILGAHRISGALTYEGCAVTGRIPCKLCNPTPDSPVRTPPPTKYDGTAPTRRRDALPAAQAWALARFQQAKKERQAGRPEEMTGQARRDFYALVNPRAAFWSAAGYRNFHLRECPRLRGLTHLKGYRRYSEAVGAGCTPCKECKPTKKQDVEYSIPLTSQPRPEERREDLEALCRAAGFPYQVEGEFLTLRTPVGVWRVQTDCKLVRLQHINLTNTPDNLRLFHRQPWLFFSLTDAFVYIQRHDEELQQRGGAGVMAWLGALRRR